jgi:hypothetical protein
MDALAPSTLMCAPATRDDSACPRPDDRPVVRALTRTWSRIVQLAKTERLDCPEPRGAQVGLFIIGYGKVYGAR